MMDKPPIFLSQAARSKPRASNKDFGIYFRKTFSSGSEASKLLQFHI